MDIQVTKVDRAYGISEELDRSTVEVSKKIAEEMKRIINNMNAHWQGEDATLHINQWIDEYEKFSIYFTELNKTSNFLQNYFVNLQMCRARTSNITKMGEQTTSKYEFEPISKVDTTAGYYYDEKLKNDYSDLVQLCNYYDKFINITDNKTNEIYSNWKIGIGREESGKYCQELSNYAKTFSKELHALTDKLAVVLYNFDKIN